MAKKKSRFPLKSRIIFKIFKISSIIMIILSVISMFYNQIFGPDSVTSLFESNKLLLLSITSFMFLWFISMLLSLILFIDYLDKKDYGK